MSGSRRVKVDAAVTTVQATTLARGELARCVAVLAVTYLILSNGYLFFYGAAQIGVVLGCMSAILVGDHQRSAWISASVSVLGAILAPPRLVFDQSGPGVWLVVALSAATAAATIGVAKRDFPQQARRIDQMVVLIVLAVLTINLWIPLVIAGVHPLVGYGPLPASALRSVPVAGSYQTDDELYRRFFYFLHEGRGHYEAFRDAWLGLRVRGELPASPTSYRLPTYYLIWRALPPDAFLIEVVFLGFATLGAVAAAAFSAQLVGLAAAPLAAAAVFVYAMGIAISVYSTYVDFPAACVLMAGLAALARWRLGQSTSSLWTGIALVTLAALMREILAYVLVLGIASTALSPTSERKRLLKGWLIGLCVFVLGYASHVVAVQMFIPSRTGHLDYSQGSVVYAVKAITQFGDVFSGAGLMLFSLFALGTSAFLNSLVSESPLARSNLSGATKRKPVLHDLSALCLMTIAIPPLFMIVGGNPGITAYGTIVNYWGQFFVPIGLSAWPVLLLAGHPRLGVSEE